MNMQTMDATYTDSLLRQALSLPDLLRPLLIDESTRDASSKLGELASEMKSLANLTSRLVDRCRNMKISVTAENQVKLQDSISDAKELSKRIESCSRSLKGMRFSITWQVNKLIKYSKKTYSNIEKIEHIFSPYFTADPYLVALIKSEKKPLSADSGLVLTVLDVKKLSDPSTEKRSQEGLKKLFADAALAR